MPHGAGSHDAHPRPAATLSPSRKKRPGFEARPGFPLRLSIWTVSNRLFAEDLQVGSLAKNTALDYAEKYGWPIFPCALVRTATGKLNKVPLIKQWPQTASCDPAQIEKWWTHWPDALISLATGKRSGTVVLDIDCKEGRWGFDTLEELGRSILPDTPIAHTVSGGVHVYFACNLAVDIRNSAGTKGLGVGLDIRGDGGQVVLPSSHSGYSWDPHKNFDNTPLVQAPAWLAHRQRKERPPAAANQNGRFDPHAILAEACRRIRHAPPGERHDAYRHETFRVARLVGAGFLSEADARHALEPEIMVLGKLADGHTDRVRKYYELSWAEGFAAAAPRRARR